MPASGEIETLGTISIVWKIENFYLVFQNNDSMFSPDFTFLGVGWYLKIYPNGRTEDNAAGWVSMYLKKRDRASKKHCISYTISIQKCDGSIFESFNKISEFEEKDNYVTSGYGKPKFFTTSQLQISKNVLSQDGSLRILCTMQDGDLRNITNVMETATQTVSSESIEILQQNFKQLLLTRINSDVIIKVKDQEFQAHRWILAARSHVFFSMFDHDTEEKKSGIVKIADLNPECFKEFLIFIYTGKMDMISSGNVTDLYKAADKYDLGDLKNECVHFMVEELSAESFYDTILLASMHNESKLLDTATDFFIENCKQIIMASEWYLLMRDHFTLANELLRKMADKRL